MTDRQELDREIVGRAQRGEEAAFTELMRHYKGPILNYVYRLTGNIAGAEDLAQETFVRAYRNLHRFAYRKASDRFSTWLFQVARHATIDVLRHQHRHPAQSLESVPGKDMAGVHSSRMNPGVEVNARETEALIQLAVSELPEDQRTVLVLSVYKALSHAEIAAIMETSEKSVEARLYRARQYLRVRLDALLA